jgi:hypothetical protein
MTILRKLERGKMKKISPYMTAAPLNQAKNTLTVSELFFSAHYIIMTSLFICFSSFFFSVFFFLLFIFTNK